MKWVRYSIAGRSHYGIMNDNETIIQVRGDPFHGYDETRNVLQLNDVRLLPPVIPGTFYCVGLNYPSHIAAMGAQPPSKPDVGYRANNPATHPTFNMVMSSKSASRAWEH